MRLWIRRRSVSSCASPGPLVPMPPPSLDEPALGFCAPVLEEVSQDIPSLLGDRLPVGVLIFFHHSICTS